MTEIRVHYLHMLLSGWIKLSLFDIKASSFNIKVPLFQFMLNKGSRSHICATLPSINLLFAFFMSSNTILREIIFIMWLNVCLTHIWSLIFKRGAVLALGLSSHHERVLKASKPSGSKNRLPGPVTLIYLCAA